MKGEINMQINPISVNQTNFKGQLIFRDAAKYTKLGKEALDYLSLTSEHIESINPVRKISPEEMPARLEKYAPAFRYGIKESLEKFKTVIRTISGVTYEVTVPHNEVSEAKRMVDYTANVTEPGVYSI